MACFEWIFFDLVFADIGFLSEYSCDRFVVKP